MKNDKKSYLQEFIADNSAKIDVILTKIEKNMKGFLIILKNEEVLGVITDGDIRRYLISKPYDKGLKAFNLCNQNFVFAKKSFSKEKKISLFTNKVKFLPILENNKKLYDIEFRDTSLREVNYQRINALAPSRITFGGGGSDKLDFFAHDQGLCINAAIKKYAFCTIIKSNDLKKIHIISIDYEKQWTFENSDEFLKSTDTRLLIYQKLFSFLNFYNPIKIITKCDFPIGSGLGGSSALTVALLGAFYDLLGYKYSKPYLAKEAFKLERLAMKINGGWQDHYAASVGGVNALYFDHNKHSVHNLNLSKKVLLDLQSTLYLCFSGKVHDSSEVHKSITLSKKVLKTKMLKTVALAEEILEQLTSGDLTKFDENVNQNWNLKKQYSSKISDKELDDQIKKFLSIGATSAKILGAGGGGYFLVRVPNENFSNFSRYCKKKSLIPERVLFEEKGVTVW